MATIRLLREAERGGVERFVFFSALGRHEHVAGTRFFRAKALAERAVLDAGIESFVLAPSIVYAPGDPLDDPARSTDAPAVDAGLRRPGRPRYQPIWAEDVAGCATASLLTERGRDGQRRYELAGPETLTYDEIVSLALEAWGRRRPLMHVPLRRRAPWACEPSRGWPGRPRSRPGRRPS